VPSLAAIWFKSQLKNQTIETEDGFGTFKLLTLKRRVLMLPND